MMLHVCDKNVALNEPLREGATVSPQPFLLGCFNLNLCSFKHLENRGIDFKVLSWGGTASFHLPLESYF